MSYVSSSPVSRMTLRCASPDGLLDLDDLLEDGGVVAGEERSAVDDHVDLVGARLDRGTRLGQLDVAERLAAGEPGRDAGDLHAAPLERLFGLRDQGRVDADRRDGRDGGITGLGVHPLDAQRPDLARRVLPLEGRQVHHPDREVERPQLRRLLDRPSLERVDTCLDPDLVHGADPSEQTAERVADRARAPIPRADQLVGALARERLGSLRGGHGTERIPLTVRRASGRASGPGDPGATNARRAPLAAAACRSFRRRGSAGTSPARSRGSRHAGTVSPSGSAHGSPPARAGVAPGAGMTAGP